MKKHLFVFFLILNISFVFSQNNYNMANELLVGRIYQEGFNNAKGHGFWINEFKNCKMSYKDLSFDSLLIKYDLLNQQIVLYQSIDSFIPRYIVLNNNFINEFEVVVNGQKFYFSPEYSKMEGVKKNVKFYQVVYNSNIKYIIGRLKRYKELGSNSETEEYIQENYYYLIVKNRAFLIRNKKDLLSVFPEFKNELKSYIKKNRLKMKPENLKDIVTLLAYYETIIKENNLIR